MYYRSYLQSINEIETQRTGIDLSSVDSAEKRIFLPVIPMLDKTPKDEGNPHFSLEDIAKLEQVRGEVVACLLFIWYVCVVFPCRALPCPSVYELQTLLPYHPPMCVCERARARVIPLSLSCIEEFFVVYVCACFWALKIHRNLVVLLFSPWAVVVTHQMIPLCILFFMDDDLILLYTNPPFSAGTKDKLWTWGHGYYLCHAFYKSLLSTNSFA